jgi:hypothetical protein
MTVAHFKDDKMAALRAKERALATLALARPASLVQLDSGLLLLMCQLFMLSENADVRRARLKRRSLPWRLSQTSVRVPSAAGA